MRGFIVLCLVAVACADQLGYNYQPVGHSNVGLSSPHGGSAGGLGGGIGGATGSIGNDGGAGRGGGDSHSIGGPSSTAAVQPELNKEFYTFSANDAEFDDPNAAQQIAGAAKKNLRVIFIKSPENSGLENAALALAKQAADQQTAIYVLHKQADIGDLVNKLSNIRNDQHSKPDVHFVKYRTPEDAANAQKAIQSQYDQLGGTSHSHNGGVAPVINFASPAQLRAPAAPRAPDNAYLPASVLRTLRF